MSWANDLFAECPQDFCIFPPSYPLGLVTSLNGTERERDPEEWIRLESQSSCKCWAFLGQGFQGTAPLHSLLEGSLRPRARSRAGQGRHLGRKTKGGAHPRAFACVTLAVSCYSGLSVGPWLGWRSRGPAWSPCFPCQLETWALPQSRDPAQELRELSPSFPNTLQDFWDHRVPGQTTHTGRPESTV